MRVGVMWPGLVLVGMLAVSVAAQPKDAPRNTDHGARPTLSGAGNEPLGGVMSDLDWDPAFTHGSGGAAGVAIYPLDYPNANIGQPLRVYAIGGGAGWYVLAKHLQDDGHYWDAVVIRVRPNGTEDAVFRVPTVLKDINDAVWDQATRKFYFAGYGHDPVLPGADDDFAVACVDIDNSPSGSYCAGFSGSGTAFVPFNLGGANHDRASRVLVRPNIGLLLVGTADLDTTKNAIAVAALYRASGALVTSFGGNGRLSTAIPGIAQPHAYVRTYDAALSNDPDAQTRLYIAGMFSEDDALHDYDGYVVALGAMTGTFDTTFGSGGIRALYLDLGNCAVNCTDAITAMTVLANGKIAVAGVSVDPDLNYFLMVGRLNRNGSKDASFRNAGLFALEYVGYSNLLMMPRAIGERPGTRDLLTAAVVRMDGNPTTPVSLSLIQWSANGWARDGTGGSLPAAPGQTEQVGIASLLVDTDAAMLLGSRRWNVTDWDVALFRTLANDTIFADMFGGPTSD